MGVGLKAPGTEEEGTPFFLFASVTYLKGGNTVTGKPEKLKHVGPRVSPHARTRAASSSSCGLQSQCGVSGPWICRGHRLFPFPPNWPHSSGAGAQSDLKKNGEDTLELNIE